MRVAIATEPTGIGNVELVDRPDPVPGPGQVLVRVHCAGVGPWDVGMLSGGFPGMATPFVPGQEISGVVETAGEGTDARPGQRVFATTFPTGGGFGELALVDAARMAPMPEKADFPEAAALVIAAGTAHEGLIDRGHLRPDQTVLVTAAAGGVGSAAVQIAAATDARVFGVASPRNHDYLRNLGASETFDYHDPDWVRQVLAACPGGVDLLMDCAGGETRDRALEAVRDNGRASLIVIQDPTPPLSRGITAESFAAHVDRERLGALAELVDSDRLRPHIEAVLPLDQVREALSRVAGKHTRGKVVVRITE
ncbi:NADP-dependent oxidoreductase [Nocardia sp. NPDC004068]|uniref:NADP-dependent oxidoreductase n=1 Tax=Nocardia sp. NPDC004068 TaxID=3364303 RepID=UPI003686560F